MAKLAERSLPIPEISGLNPVIGSFIYYQLYLKVGEKTKIKKEKRSQKWPNFMVEFVKF